MTLLAPGCSFHHIRGLVAQVLLRYAEDGTTERRRLAQRDIASLVGTDWETVHMSLKSLQDEGAIRIERHRLIINKGSLQKMADGTTVALANHAICAAPSEEVLQARTGISEG